MMRPLGMTMFFKTVPPNERNAVMGLYVIPLIGLPLVAITSWQFTLMDMNLSDTDLWLMLAARWAAMGLVIMPTMTAALTGVSCQVFGSFGTAIFLTILQSRQTFHAVQLARTATPDNLTLQMLLNQAQQYVASQGGTLEQGQALGLAAVSGKVALDAAVWVFQDVFLVASLITLLAMIPALFLQSQRRTFSAPAQHVALDE